MKPRDPLYGVWNGMKQRCFNPNSTGYANYGGRGISVCRRWRESFQHFKNDMGPKPHPTYQLDRRNNDGDYTPKNCRWVSPSQNGANRKRVAFDKQNLVHAARQPISINGILHRNLRICALERRMPMYKLAEEIVSQYLDSIPATETTGQWKDLTTEPFAREDYTLRRKQ